MKKRKMMSFVLSVCMVVLAFSAVSVPASADADIAMKRMLILSAPYDSEISWDNIGSMLQAVDSWNEYNNLCGTDYEYQAEYYRSSPFSGTNQAVENAITSRFEDSDGNDVNYLFVHCHWDVDAGALAINGTSNSCERLSFSELKQTLDSIPGRFVIMFDVCYSGLAIDRSNSSAFSENSDGYSQLLLNQFLGEDTRSGEFAGSQRYTVFCSSYSAQRSFMASGAGIREGNASLAWMRCLGYNPYPVKFNHTFITPAYGADANRDGIITGKQFGNNSRLYLTEWMSYANAEAEEQWTGPGEYEPCEQNICYYAHNKMSTAFFNKYPLGDVNRNYSVNMADVLLVRQYLAGSVTLVSEQLTLADTNQDGNVNTQDLLEMEKYMAEIAT